MKKLLVLVSTILTSQSLANATISLNIENSPEYHCCDVRDIISASLQLSKDAQIFANNVRWGNRLYRLYAFAVNLSESANVFARSIDELNNCDHLYAKFRKVYWAWNDLKSEWGRIRRPAGRLENAFLELEYEFNLTLYMINQRCS